MSTKIPLFLTSISDVRNRKKDVTIIMMAILNTKEKLICRAAQKDDSYLHAVFKRFYLHFQAESETEPTMYDDCYYINFLYCNNHKTLSFNNIASRFHISLSALEDRRKKYIHIFYFYLKSLNAESEAALTVK